MNSLLLHNFSPSCPAARDETGHLVSPAARLNQDIYHDNWLHNLQIAASIGSFRNQRNPL